MNDQPPSEDFARPPIALVWESEPPPDREAVETMVRADMARNLRHLFLLGRAHNLVFHHVFLTDDMNGPSVFVYGRDGSDAYHCKYDEKTIWVTLDCDGNRVEADPA